MPRKQRFKPSRKPKQPQPAEIHEIQPTSTAAQSSDIERAEPMRSHGDAPTSVIEESDTGQRGA